MFFPSVRSLVKTGPVWSGPVQSGPVRTWPRLAESRPRQAKHALCAYALWGIPILGSKFVRANGKGHGQYVEYYVRKAMGNTFKRSGAVCHNRPRITYLRHLCTIVVCGQSVQALIWIWFGLKLWTTVHPSNNAPIDLKLCQNASPTFHFSTARTWEFDFMRTLNRGYLLRIKLGQNAFQTIPNISSFDPEIYKNVGFCQCFFFDCWLTIWSDDHHVIICPRDRMIKWSYDDVTIWSNNHVTMWSYDLLLIWLYDLMITWSYEHIAMGSYDGTIVWSSDDINMVDDLQSCGPYDARTWSDLLIAQNWSGLVLIRSGLWSETSPIRRSEEHSAQRQGCTRKWKWVWKFNGNWHWHWSWSDLRKSQRFWRAFVYLRIVAPCVSGWWSLLSAPSP